MPQRMTKMPEDPMWQEKGTKKCACHLNSLSSLVYSVVSVGLCTYIIATEIIKFIEYFFNVPWHKHNYPELELNLHISLVGVAIVFMPFFFGCAILKVGNFANDGYRLGTHDGACSKDPPPIPNPSGGCFQHTGPISVILHLAIAHVLLMAKMVLEGAAVKGNQMGQDYAWRSELSNIIPDRERMTIFSQIVNHVYSAVGETMSKRDDYSARYQEPLFTTPDVVVTDSPFTTSSPLYKNITIRGKDEDHLWYIGGVPWGPLSPHLINYLVAHLFYATRYAGVFWGTNKAFGLVFFVQLLINALHNVFVLNGFIVLYKVRSIDEERVLVNLGPFLMDVPTSAAVFTLTQGLVLFSSFVFYHYGWTKFQHFIASEKEKYHIMSKHGYEVRCGYLPHTLALLWLVLMTAATAPLLYDFLIVFRGSADSSVLSASLACLLHTVLWIIMWIGLTAKSWWTFKVRVQVSQATVSGPHSVRLVNEVQLSGQLESVNSPLLVLAEGKTYLIQDQDPKRALMKTVMGAVSQKKAEGREDEIYWVVPNSLRKMEMEEKSKPVYAKETVDGKKSKRKKSGDRSLAASDSDHTIDSDGGDMAKLRDVSFPGPSQKLRQANSENDHMKCPDPTSILEGAADFPAPPPELSGLSYPPRLSTPPSPPPPLPPLPEEELTHGKKNFRNHHKDSKTTPQNKQTYDAYQQQQRKQHLQQNQPNLEQINDSLLSQEKAHNKTGLNAQLSSRLENNSREGSPPQYAAFNPQIKIVKGDSFEATSLENQDSSSPVSSVTPPDKRYDSGIHSQGSSSTGTHSKSGSSGSEDCVPTQPPPMQPLHIESVGLPSSFTASHHHHHRSKSPTEPPPGIPRCSSVDDLCTGGTSPPPPAPTSAKTMSLQRNTSPPYDEKNRKINIQVVGGGYGFLPPSKFVSSEPIYSDASTPVVIRRRGSITAVEPDIPTYERSAGSFSTFTEPLPALPSLPRSMTRGDRGGSHMFSASNPFPGSTRLGIYARGLNMQRADNKNNTIASAGGNTAKGFHHPEQVDPRYFSVPTARGGATSGEILSQYQQSLPNTQE